MKRLLNWPGFGYNLDNDYQLGTGEGGVKAMNVVFPVVTTVLFVLTGICTWIVINHHHRVRAWRNQRGTVEL